MGSIEGVAVAILVAFSCRNEEGGSDAPAVLGLCIVFVDAGFDVKRTVVCPGVFALRPTI